MDIKDLLFKLSCSDGIGTVTDAADLVFEELNKYAPAKREQGLTVTGFLKGKSDYTVMLDAHIDQVGFIVTDISQDGFLTVAKCGGIDLRVLPSRPVTIHGKKKIEGVFCSTPPHLSKGEACFDDISALKIDTCLGKSAADFVAVGDYVTFSAKPRELAFGKVTGRSFDDRAGVVTLLETAKRLKGKELPVNVVFCFSDAEEIGTRGIRTAAFSAEPDEAVAIDVTFADAPGIPEEECCKMGSGPMIGFSPVLDAGLSRKLTLICEENGIPFGREIMGSVTGTNADMISVSKGGVKACTVSVPIRNMHTDAEVLKISDLEQTCDLLEKYILSGGLLND